MIEYRSTQNLFELYSIQQYIKTVDVYYPDFNNWYVNTVVPGVVSGKTHAIVAEDDQQFVGVILCRSQNAKIQCIRVMPSYANRGIGLHLIDRALHKINQDKPVVTVPEELINDYSRILVNRYAFDLSTVAKGKYRPKRLEYVFNDSDSRELKQTTPYGTY